MKRFVRALVQLASLPFLAAYVLVPMVLTRRRRMRCSGTKRIALVTPFGAGTRSGSARAERDLIEMLSADSDIKVIGLRGLDPHPGFLGRFIGRVIGSALPMEQALAGFVADAEPVLSRLGAADLIFVEFVYGSLFLFRSPRINTPLVVRDHEVLARRFAADVTNSGGVLTGIGGAIRLAVVWLVTAHIYRQADRIVTLTPEDASWLQRWFPFSRDKVVAIPVSFKTEPLNDADIPVRNRDLLYAANFYHQPNVDGLVWFLSECAPQIERDVTLHLIGLDEPLKKVTLPETALKIVRHGHVEDIERECASIPIALAPLISGGGIRIKNLLFAAMAKAIVTTSLANEGIGFEDGRNAMVCDDPRAFAQAINRLISDPALAKRLGSSARNLLIHNFSHEAIRARYKSEVFAPLGC